MEDLIQNLQDAGCDARTIAAICRLYAAGETGDAVAVLRRYRCGLLDRLHQCQERIDCLDFLIRRMESEYRRQGNIHRERKAF